MRRLSSARLAPNRFTKAGKIGTLALTIACLGNGLIGDRTLAQLATCQPPKANEYLLLAVTPSAEDQARVTAILPVSSPTTTCNYLGETVLRVGGFNAPETANAWAEYVAKQAKVSAFVAKPPTSGTPSVLPPLPPAATLPTTPVAPTPVGAPTPNRYNPQPLGSGYAVLVNYYNNPTIAQQVAASTGQTVSLVSYGQQPYLLASFTSDQSAANVLLQALTDKGLWASIVDGRRVMLLKSNVGQ
ncbi:hypothetical protein IQ266_06155 [filamentous cyanobacterium LEGE 11480]|uniref:Uncharacterized protein n=1 Tax=Romeriopsis navalis LEGE 11480 TaxID=2777977 RepID=A0A928Z2A5_9CYAN|nr:hypothetical protein [Romeriopsis navalis]MBE9029344.1 hypothetical protein [Romeriopsis navalis LEGE 11480]